MPNSGCREFQGAHWHRRQMLQAGGLGLLGFGMADLLAARALGATKTASSGFGSAKRCILLFMWGGPSQLDTFDPKPNAPAEVRGPFKAIDTNVPGVQISEHFQRLARTMDKIALVRSLSHDDPAHLSSGHLALTGHLAPVVKSDADPPSPRDTPHLGAVLAKLRPATAALPAFVTMPWQVSHPAAPGGMSPGQHGGWLGRSFDPLIVTGDPNAPNWRVSELGLQSDLSLPRLTCRNELLRLIDGQRQALAKDESAATTSSFQQQAFGLLGSTDAREAFDLAQEDPRVRDNYGRNIHGQCVLLARRLIERGVPLVNVNWHNDGHNFWDTHGNNFNRLQNDLIPPADRALAALLEDLDQRGLLADTVVAWFGEFGRAPRISANNAGREHFPGCYSGLLAGGGVRGGTILGKSDALASAPAERPVRPQDFVATLYHALGVPTEASLPDRLNRPLQIYAGTPLTELF